MITQDNGNSGIGGGLSDTDIVNITVTSVNDDPIAVADTDSATTVAFGDLDAILVSDIAAGATPDPNATQLLTNDGTGGFSASDAGTPDLDAQDVKLADFDGDSDLDAFITAFGSADQVLINQGGTQGGTEGQFSLGAALPAATSTLGLGSAVGDVDGDGDIDVIVTDFSNSDAATLFTNNGSGVFTASNLGVAIQSRDVALGDVDGDGDLDVLLANDTGFTHLLINRGDLNNVNGLQGTFAAPVNVGGFNRLSVDVVFGDIDGDGDLDALIANTEDNANGHSGINQVLVNNGSGSFTVLNLSAGGDFKSTSIALGDVDGDGDLDAIIVNFDGQANQVLLNDGTGTFTEKASAITGDGLFNDSTDVALADIDGDGDLDAFITNNGSSDFNQVLINDGTGSFTSSDFFDNTSNSFAIAFGDLDGDGFAPTLDANGLPNINLSPIVTGSVATNDSDTEDGAGENLTYALNAPVAGLALAADGTYTFDPTNSTYAFLGAGQTLDVVANYTVTDSGNATAQSTLTITVTGSSSAAIIGDTGTGSLVIDDTSETSVTVTGNVGLPTDAEVDDGYGGSYGYGTEVLVEAVIIGNQAGSIGIATVTDTNDTGVGLNINGGNLTVGKEGTGTLTVSAGANITIDSENQDNSIPGDFTDLVVGATTGGTGALTITGIGSNITTKGTDNNVRIGFNGGDGTLTVADGGTLDTFFFEVGRNAGSTGVATVTGVGSEIIISSQNGFFSIDGFDFEAGFGRVGRDGGTGTLNILLGGRVEVREGTTSNTDKTSPEFQLGRNGGTGTVVIDGTGSTMSITQNTADGNNGPRLTIGRGDNAGILGGTGTFTVQNNGLAELIGENARLFVGTSDVVLGGALTSGTLNILSGGDVLVNGTSPTIGGSGTSGLNHLNDRV